MIDYNSKLSEFYKSGFHISVAIMVLKLYAIKVGSIYTEMVPYRAI